MLIKVESVLLFGLFYLLWKNVQDKKQICQVVQQKGCLFLSLSIKIKLQTLQEKVLNQNSS